MMDEKQTDEFIADMAKTVELLFKQVFLMGERQGTASAWATMKRIYAEAAKPEEEKQAS